jgi:DNA primase
MVKQDVDYSLITDILEDILGDYKMHNEYKGQISFDCPVCSYEIKGLDHGDGKGNLEINYKNNVFKCWSCSETNETHGSIYKLIKKFGNNRQLKKYQLLRPDDDGSGNKRFYKKIKLPKEFIPFSNVTLGMKMTPFYKQALNYVRKRNITDEMLQKFNIGFCNTGMYENRIIIPSYDEDKELNYFVARSYLTRTKLKYKNPSVQKELIIWNEYLINWDNPVYLVEGAFDSIFLPNSIPMLGKFMTDKLFKKLYQNAKKIIIVLDGDAYEDAVKLYHKINCGKLMGKVWIVELPKDKDIADLQGNLNNYNIKQID